MKKLNHVGVAEFANAKGIDDEPEFAWWVPYKLRKQGVVISSINTGIRKKLISMEKKSNKCRLCIRN